MFNMDKLFSLGKKKRLNNILIPQPRNEAQETVQKAGQIIWRTDMVTKL